jgi:hypothetical protein
MAETSETFASWRHGLSRLVGPQGFEPWTNGL